MLATGCLTKIHLPFAIDFEIKKISSVLFSYDSHNIKKISIFNFLSYLNIKVKKKKTHIHFIFRYKMLRWPLYSVYFSEHLNSDFLFLSILYSIFKLIKKRIICSYKPCEFYEKTVFSYFHCLRRYHIVKILVGHAVYAHTIHIFI